MNSALVTKGLALEKMTVISVPGDDQFENAKDECGICFGDNTLCADCLDNPNGTAVIDDCGECVSPEDFNQSQDDCGVCFGNNDSKDICGVCGGDNSSCVECGSVDISSTLFALDGLAFDQFQVNRQLVRQFRRRTGKKGAFAEELRRSEQLYIEKLDSHLGGWHIYN